MRNRRGPERRPAARSRRGPGRPRGSVITRERVLSAALARIEREGLAAMTMTGLARELGVNPMALYHYFADRDELLVAAADRAYAPLRGRQTPAREGADWEAALLDLAVSYLELLAGAGELLRYVTSSARAAEVPTVVVATHVYAALAPLGLGERARTTAHDVFVDFVHGFALGVPRTGMTPRLRRALRGELAVVCAGIAHLARTSVT